MIQENSTLLFCLVLLVISCIVYQYIEITKTKKNAFTKLNGLKNQICKEQHVLNLNIKKVARINESEKEIHQKLVTLKTDIVLIDFTLHEIFTLL